MFRAALSAFGRLLVHTPNPPAPPHLASMSTHSIEPLHVERAHAAAHPIDLPFTNGRRRVIGIDEVRSFSSVRPAPTDRTPANP